MLKLNILDFLYRLYRKNIRSASKSSKSLKAQTSQKPSIRTGNHFLIFGNGYISGEVQALLASSGESFTVTTVRLEDRTAIAKVLDEVQPTHVFNAAGARGDKNADWCEDHKIETMNANVLGAMNVVDLCYQRGIHVTHFGSGCIYELNLGGKPYVEEDAPNFTDTFYGYSKIVSENSIKHYPNVLILRLRFPIAANLAVKNHLTKILTYKKLFDIPNANSGSILPNLLPGALIMAKHRETGVYNFTNPGVFGNNAIMESFKRKVRPSLEWENCSESEQVLKTRRSNCYLDPSKLVNKLKEYNYEVLDVHTAMDQTFASMKKRGFT